jgi:hypothetical protein
MAGQNIFLSLYCVVSLKSNKLRKYYCLKKNYFRTNQLNKGRIDAF